MAADLLVDHDHDERVARMGFCSECAAVDAARALGTDVLERADGFQGDLWGDLEGQVRKVAEALGDGRWHTLRQLAGQLDSPEQSVLARLRDLRKDEFGGHVVEKRRRAKGYEYRLSG